MSHPAFTGILRAHLADLIAELAGPWTASCESALHHQRGRKRKRQAGAGPKHELLFTDQVVVTLVYLRLQLPHAALAELYGMERSTITRAIGEIRPLLAQRRFAVRDPPGIRLHTLADVFAYAEAEAATLRIDGTETQVRRPQAHRRGRTAFISGKKKQNTIKTTTISDGQGRTLWSGADWPGRMHDQTAMRTEGIAEQFRLRPGVKAEVDEGYRGLANEFPEQVSAPPRKRKDHARMARDTPGARHADGSPPAVSAWSTPTLSTNSGAPAAVRRPPRTLRPDPPCVRRLGLRLRRRPAHEATNERRTRPRQPGRLLIAPNRTIRTTCPDLNRSQPR
ncbi:transposase family protein [Streptomyces mirabilis]|uniref:transposase family protein n=1 Tax=Streptomyces mirabilis TaxID=68239 RepID=UPI003405E1E8